MVTIMCKIIHYCWFGRNPKSATMEKCIASWKRYFPSWQLIEWNEENFDVRINTYVSQAYDAKKWAFVSDYVRFWALEKYGGIYFDTDVEVIRSFTPLLSDQAFVGFETDKFLNPGLVLYASKPNHAIISETRQWYDSARFLDDDGERIKKNVCNIFTDIISNYGYVPNGKTQTCGGIKLYPKDFFCPFDDTTGILTKTENTYSIHWYDKSWMPKRKILRNKITRIIHRFFGTDIKNRLKQLFWRTEL